MKKKNSSTTPEGKRSGAKKPGGKKVSKSTALKKSVTKNKAKSVTQKKKNASRAKVKTVSKKSSKKKTVKKSTANVKSGAKKRGRHIAENIKSKVLVEDNKQADRRKITPPHVPHISGVGDDLEAKFVLGLPGLTDETLKESPPDLPDNYGDHRLTLIARDSRWAFCYWEIDPAKQEEGLRKSGDNPEQTYWNLRAYRLPASKKGTGVLFADLGVDFSSGKSYLELSPPGAVFLTELGLMDQHGNFVAIVASNIIELPADRPSEIFDEQWTLGENVQKAFYESLVGRMEESELTSGERSKPSFGVSSYSRLKK